MDNICHKLIGKSKLYILDYAKENNLVVNFSHTKGHKDSNILTEEYAVKANYDNGEIQESLILKKGLIRNWNFLKLKWHKKVTLK